MENSYASTAAKQKIMFLDVRPYFNCIEAPNETLIAAAVRVAYPADPQLIIKPMTGRMHGCYKVASTTEPTDNVLKFSRKKRDDTGLEVVSIPLTPYSGTQGERREGTLVTIVDGDMGDAHALPSSVFNTAMAEFGEVVMSTKPQINKATNLYNGNLMVVVDTTNSKKKLPNRISVEGKTFLIKYKGKIWHCHTCKTDHSGSCPYLKAFYEALDKKKAINTEHLICGDSTVKLCDHVGINADILSMPGATAGQLAAVIEDHPDITKYNRVSIAAGANDVRAVGTPTKLEMAKIIDYSVQKLKDLTIKKKDLKVDVLITAPPTELEETPLTSFSKLYLTERLNTIFANNTMVKVLDYVHYPEDWVNGHPTKPCTEVMVNALSSLAPDLIINKDYITTETPYQGVTKLYLSGCTGCNSRGNFEKKFCKACLDSIELTEDPADFELYKRCDDTSSDESYPRKRGRLQNSSDSSDDCHHGKYDCSVPL